MTDEDIITEDEMDNPKTISCPDCETEGKVPEWFIGEEVECRSCETHFTA